MSGKKLIQVAEKKLAKTGFLPTQNRRYDYYCTLKAAGEIGATYKLNCFKRKNGITFFMMFSSPKQALSAGFDCNSYSGKYNFYSCTTIDEIDYVLGHLINRYWETD